MRRLRRVIAVLSLFVAATRVQAEPETPAHTPDSVALSLAAYTDMVLSNGLRSQINSDRFRSARWGWEASLRVLSLPQLTASANRTRLSSNDDAGTETTANATKESLSVSQPFLTGAQLSLSSSWERTVTDVTASGVTTTGASVTRPALTASLTQPLFVFVGNSSLRSRREAILRWENDQDAYRAEWLQIRFEARSLYYNLLLQSETANVEKTKFESAQLVHSVTGALVREGKLAGVELARADIRAQRDRRRIQNAENTYEQSLNQARDLALLPRSKAVTLTSPLSDAPFTIPMPSLINCALEYNTSLRTAKREIDLAEIGLRRTQEGERPRVNATGSYAKSMSRNEGSPALDPDSWQVGVGVDWAFFDASQTRLHSRQDAVSVENARRSAENISRQLRVSIENTYLDLKRAEDQIGDFASQRNVAEKNLEATRLQYRNGIARLTDVFDAENELRDLELERLGVLVAYNVAKDQLSVLIGKDIDELPGGVN